MTTFDVIPAIDIRNGRCVRLFQGDYSQETVYDDDPVAVARRWAAAGAPRLHVVDLDAARLGHPANRDVILAITRAVSIPVQVGGGIRDEATARGYLEAGVARIVLGTAAVADRPFTDHMLAHYADAVLIGIDARDGEVRTQGWTASSGVRVIDLAQSLAAAGARRFFYTDIGRDATLTAPDYATLRALVQAVPAEVIASGGVARVDQLPALIACGAAGVIIGKALYTGAVDLTEALRVASDAQAARAHGGA